uniref:ULP_PROTEASE domain-containing protein n=1 Tax=Gongylonema pulchrum TaxID=637853 RepID=A0A183EN59_9BILA
LVIPPLDKDIKDYLDAELFKKFRDEVMLIELPAYPNKDRKGNCGMYTAILTTDRFSGITVSYRYVYVPVFGNDPNNWKRGHSTMMDKMIIHMIEVRFLNF